MKITVTKIRDALTPDLRRKMATAKNPRKALQAIGLTVTSLTQRAFTQPSLRPSPWPALKAATIKAKRRDGYGSKPLMSSTMLSRSPRIVSVDQRSVTVGSDRKAGGQSLSAVHQYGTKDKRVPARPHWPFTRDGRPTARAAAAMTSAAKAALRFEVVP